nr:MAG TPA: hypothetical protein [Caudoviricetes sp.]
MYEQPFTLMALANVEQYDISYLCVSCALVQ